MDFENLVLLEDFLEPGTTLNLEKKCRKKRLEIFCDLYEKLHCSEEKKSSERSYNYKCKSYKEWIFGITEYMETQEPLNEMTVHMKRARAWYLELAEQYTSKTLLHGDFHYYNILKSELSYKIIDPKGVIGHPIFFDIPRYILNEFWDEEESNNAHVTLDKVLKIVGERLNISRLVLSKLLYIEGTMAWCWCVEDGMDCKEQKVALEELDWLYKLKESEI